MKTRSLTLYPICLILISLFLMTASCGYQNKPTTSVSPSQETEERRRAEEEKKRNKEEIEQAYTRKISEYAQLPSRKQLTDTPSISGTLIILEREEPRKEFSLSPETILYRVLDTPPPPETVTVALLVYRRVSFGQFKTDDGKTLPAYRIDCDVTLIDRTIQAIVYRQVFRGEDPETTEMLGDKVAYVEPGQTEILGKRANVIPYLRTFPRVYPGASSSPAPVRKR